MTVVFCRQCNLAQLSAVVRPEILYKDYCYVTGASDTMKSHFELLLNDVTREYSVPLKPGQKPARGKLLEIGSNNGGFLEFASCKSNWEVLGIEPAKNLADLANARGLKTIDRLFGEPEAVQLAAAGYKADVIVARHVFAHIDDWKGFIHALEFISHKDTLVVIEVPYAGDMLKMNSWDQIYHEHLSFVSITAIVRLLNHTQFYLHSVKNYSIHGGSIALLLRRTDGPPPTGGVLEGVSNRLDEEKTNNLEDRWLHLADMQAKMRSNLTEEVQKAKLNGKKVCGFGASAKATVWCNACGFTSKDIAFVCDSTEQKQGKLIAGTDIKVVPEKELLDRKPDYAINFSWNFHREIAQKHKAFTERGGKWIQVVPEVRVLC